MPLTQVSPNLHQHVGHSPSSQSLSAHPGSSLAPGAVQSMLKTTTETGDIGQFSVRPSVPRSGSRVLALRQRSGSFDATFVQALSRHTSRPHRSSAQTCYGPRKMTSPAALFRNDTIRSSLNSYGNNP